MSKEFNWKKYQSAVIKKCIDKYGSREQAIVEMDAEIGSLRLKSESLGNMVDWEKIEREIDDEEEAKQAKSA